MALSHVIKHLLPVFKWMFIQLMKVDDQTVSVLPYSDDVTLLAESGKDYAEHICRLMPQEGTCGKSR